MNPDLRKGFEVLVYQSGLVRVTKNPQISAALNESANYGPWGKSDLQSIWYGPKTKNNFPFLRVVKKEEDVMDVCPTMSKMFTIWKPTEKNCQPLA